MTSHSELEGPLTLAVRAALKLKDGRLAFIGKHLLAQLDGATLPVADGNEAWDPSQLKELSAELTKILNSTRDKPGWPVRAVATELVGTDAAPGAAAAKKTPPLIMPLGKPLKEYSGAEIRQVLTIFAQFDADNSGALDAAEMKALCDTMGIEGNVEEADTLVKDGLIDPQEFFAWYTGCTADEAKKAFVMHAQQFDALSKRGSLAQYTEKEVADVLNVFKQFDADGSGYLDEGEMKQLGDALGLSASMEDADSLVQDGKVDPKEFFVYYTGCTIEEATTVFDKYKDSFAAAEKGAAPVVPPFVQAAFDSMFDKNADGAISIKELHAGLKTLGMEVPKEQMAAVFNKFDTDGSFKIEINEFYELYRQFKGRPTSILPDATPADGSGDAAAAASGDGMSKEARELFDTVFDVNSDGQLSVSEVHKGLKKLGITVPTEEMSTLFNQFDTNANFRLEPMEFYELYRKQAAAPGTLVKTRTEEELAANSADVVKAPPAVPQGVQDAFELLDVDKDGKLSVKEVHKGLTGLGVEKSVEEVLTVFSNFDTDKDALLGLTEFHSLFDFFAAYVEQAAIDNLEATIKAIEDKAIDEAARSVLPAVRKVLGADRYNKVTNMFSNLDVDGDKNITNEEFCQRLDALSVHQIAIDGLSALFKKIDADAGGTISYRELTKVLREGLGPLPEAA